MMNPLIKRKGMLLFALTAMVANLAQSCPTVIIPSPFGRTVRVELTNTTLDPVDPGLFVNGIERIVDPPLDPDEFFPLDIPCRNGTTLETDATLFFPTADIFSDNVPFLEEGFEFNCGDTVSFIFIDDGVVFFTRVEVNGVFLTD